MTSTSMVVACSDEDVDASDEEGDTAAADLEPGSTAIVFIANPVVNEGHEGNVPPQVSDLRVDIEVDAEPGGEGRTDGTGLTVLEAEPGMTTLFVGPHDSEERATLEMTVQEAGDVYDAAVAYDEETGEFFPSTPIRYPVGEASGAIYLEPGTPIADIEDALSVDEAVVVLRPGEYPGDLIITGRGVLLYGEGFSQQHVVIGGSIDARGEEVRLRGLTLDGGVTAAGNNFGMSFMIVRGNADITGNGGAFIRNVFCGETTVPSSSATLLDNYGLAPPDEAPEEACNPEAAGDTDGTTTG